jgi:hypothetical protein
MLSIQNVVSVGADKMNRRKRHNYLTVFADFVAKRDHLPHRQNHHGLGCICWEIAAQWVFQDRLYDGRPYERSLNQGCERQLWERGAGIGQVPCNPV